MATRTGTRKRTTALTLPSGAAASVSVSRGGAGVQVDGVPPKDAEAVLRHLLAVFRRVETDFPEIGFTGPDTIPGGAVLEVEADPPEARARERRPFGFVR